MVDAGFPKRPISQSVLMRPGPVKGSPKVEAQDIVPVVASRTAMGNTWRLSGGQTSPVRHESQRVVCEGSFCDSSSLIERCTRLHTWMPMGRRIP